MNGVDALSYLDIAAATVVPFIRLDAPTAPTLSNNSVGGTGFKITYRLSENSTVGETPASSALSVDVDTDRDFWNPPSNGGTDYITLTLPAAASNVQSRNLYMGTVAGSEYLIASGITASAVTFTDDGSFSQDTSRLFPTTNSTEGPKTSRGTTINGRPFMVGDKDNPYLVWFGGDPGFEMDFSPANGGGNQLVGNGTKDLPIAVKSFRDGKGNAQITVLCQGTNGKGKRFILSPDSVTLGNTIISFYDVTEDNGQDGTDSPDAVITYQDSLWYPSRDGFKTTGTKPQLQNVLSTNRISNTIQPDLTLLTSTAMPGSVGLGFEGRLYWAVPVSSTMNSEIWVLDLDRKGAWMKPWSIAADWMWLYNDNTGDTHHLILSNNTIYALSYAALTNDDGDSFNTNGQSGQIYFSDDKRMWVQLLQVIIVLLSPLGEISFQITGKTEDSDLQALGIPTTYTAEATTTIAGWGEINRYITGWGRNRWSGVNLIPTTVSSATKEVSIEIDEEIQWASYAWSSVDPGVDYTISDIIYEFIEVGIKDLQ